jgi:hypothetical protein
MNLLQSKISRLPAGRAFRVYQSSPMPISPAGRCESQRPQQHDACLCVMAVFASESFMESITQAGLNLSRISSLVRHCWVNVQDLIRNGHGVGLGWLVCLSQRLLGSRKRKHHGNADKSCTRHLDDKPLLPVVGPISAAAQHKLNLQFILDETGCAPWCQSSFKRSKLSTF